MNQNTITTRYLPWLIIAWVLCMLLSLKCGWLNPFFWAAQHATVQGIDYFALPKSFLNLMDGQSLYDSWHGVPFGPYATWYLAHPVFSILVMPWFAFFPAWTSYTVFVLFSLCIMVYCGALFARQANNPTERSLYYGFFLLAFPLYWMLYVGNMHAPLVLSITLIFLALYDMAYSQTEVKSSQYKLLAGLLLSFFTKPIVILLIPTLLIAKETRKTMAMALVIYSLISLLVICLPLLNPESIGWAKRVSVMFDFDYIKHTMNIYKNQFVLNEYMKDNANHWFNLIAQSGYRFNHIENFSFPVFIDTLFNKSLPDAMYLLPILSGPILSTSLFFIQDKSARLELLLLLVMMSSVSFFLSYNTVWEYQYTSMLPVVALLYLIKDKALFSKNQIYVLLAAGSFFYLPSFYFLLDQTNTDAGFISMVRVSREIPVLIFYLLMGYQVVMRIKSLNNSTIKYIVSVFGITLSICLPTWFVWNLLEQPLTGTDDSVIFFKYARNFAHGHGIVYNVGGEHVEGFSSPLYFYICTLFYFITDTPQKIIIFFNVIMGVFSALFMLSALKKIAQASQTTLMIQALIGAIYLSWLIINPLYYGWTIISLMDTGLYSFLLIASYAYFTHALLDNRISSNQNIIISLLIAFIILCRPEGLLWGGVYLLTWFIVSYKQKETFVSAAKNLLYPAITYAGTITVVTVFRLVYFGYPLPNTYYSKVSSSFTTTMMDGFDYFQRYVELYGSIIFVPVFILLAWTVNCFFSKKEKSVYFYLSFITLAFVFTGLVMPIIEGGDHFNGFRFYQTTYPFLILPFLLLVFIYNKIYSFKTTLISSLLFIGFLLHFDQASWGKFKTSNSDNQPIADIRMCISNEFSIAKNEIENGKRLNDIFQGNLPIIGFGSAGGIAYGYDGVVYDLMGLNNTQLAHADDIKTGPKGHQSFNKNVFYTLAPDILMPRAVSSAEPVILSQAHEYYSNPNGWDNLIFKNIFNDDEFKNRYSLAAVHNSKQPAYSCFGYFKKEYLEILRQQRFEVQVFI